MKFPIFIYSIFFVLLAQVAFAQKPLTFQSYARDNSGAAITNVTVQVRSTLHIDGAPKYTEIQNVSTDGFGVFTILLGEGTATLGEFRDLNFLRNDYFLKVEIENAGLFNVISDTKLPTVAYAKYSDKATFANNGVEPGSIIPFGGPVSNIPPGYIVCDGVAYSITDPEYANLFTAIGTSWGANGAGTFRVPDLQGYFLRGVDPNTTDPDGNTRTALYTGGATGRNVGSYQEDAFQSHNHGSGSLEANSSGSHFHTLPDIGDGGGSGTVIDGTDVAGSTNRTGLAGNHSHALIGNTATEGGGQTHPKNAYVYFIIKL